MPQLLGDLLIKLILKGGLKADDERFKPFLSSDHYKVEIPDDMATAIDNGVIGLADAKNNHPEIKKHYWASALNGVDKNIDSLIEELGLDDTVKSAIKAEPNTFNRPGILIKAIQSLEQKKANADKPDKKAIQDQIDALHTQIRQANEKATASEKAAEERIKQYRINMNKTKLFHGVKTVYDALGDEVKETALSALVDKKLQDNNAHFTEDENGNIVLLKKDGTNYYGDDNKQVNAKQFVEQLLSQNKILQVTTPPPPANGSNNQQQPGQHNPAMPPNGTNGNNGNNNNGSALLKDLLKTSVTDLVNANNVPAFGMGS